MLTNIKMKKKSRGYKFNPSQIYQQLKKPPLKTNICPLFKGTIFFNRKYIFEPTEPSIFQGKIRSFSGEFYPFLLTQKP